MNMQPRMSDEKQPQELNVEPETDEAVFEYRPYVKYVGLGLAALFILGSGYTVYQLGYNQGYDAAVVSEQVAASLNEAAVQNLTHFMQTTVADDAHLREIAAAPEKHLAWIRDAAVRRESMWVIAHTLMLRAMEPEATSVLDKLYAEAPRNRQWARRASEVGAWLHLQGNRQASIAWYRRAADYFKADACAAEYVESLGYLLSLHMADNPSAGMASSVLGSMQGELQALGAEAHPLMAFVYIHEGMYLRSLGKFQEADKCFAAVLKLLPGSAEEVAKQSPMLAVCSGVAYLSKGDANAAEPLLICGEQALGQQLPDVLCRLLALRHLAEIATQRDNLALALSLLNRAEGMAQGRIAAENSFWHCLFDQRGWLGFLSREYASAHEDFERALKANPTLAARVQSLEGAGRCCMQLKREADALNYFQECETLRRKDFAGEVLDLGRIVLLQAQTMDQQGRYSDAAEAYGKAAELLKGQDDAFRFNRVIALMGRGYALGQLAQWQPALDTWQEVLPLVEDEPERRNEVQNAIKTCRWRLNIPAEG